MEADQPLVSVILPVYNAEKYVFEAVQSILNQTYKNLELIVIDDCSTDKSFEILKSIKDPRIKLYQNEKNLKLIQTLNKAIQLSSGAYIARMDADDVSLPDRLKYQVEYLQQNPQVSVLGTQIRFIDENGIKKGKPFFCVRGDEAIKWRFHFGNCMNHPTIMFRREVVDRNDFYDSNYPHAEDYELWLRLSRKYNFDNLPETLLLYRVHLASVSHRFNEIQVKSSSRALSEHLFHSLGIQHSTKLLEAVLFPRLPAEITSLEISNYFRAFYPVRFDLKVMYFYLRFKERFFRFFYPK